MSNAPPVDNLTIEKYRLTTCIATGHHSQVWEVIDNETSRRCAMKLLLPEALKEGDALPTLKHEFKVGSTFEHPHIIKYFDCTAKRKLAYFTMDLFPSPNLKAQMYGSLRMVQVRAKKLIETVALALEHVHDKGWVHRDVKPENILMNKSAEVRLIDFSLSCRSATMLSKVFSRKQSTVQGTRTYMAPEQIMGKPLTAQTDIYSLGVVLYEILTGQPPFSGATPKELLLKHLSNTAPAPSSYNPNVTEEMDRIVGRMLSKKPENRQKKIGELMAELRSASFFKEAVTDAVELTEEEKAKQELERTLGNRLDSRTDALRSKFGGPPGAKPAEPAKKVAPKPAPSPAPAAKSPAAQTPMPGMGMPQPMLPQPMAGHYPPGYPQGQFPPAQYPPGQYPMAPQYAPAPYPMPPMPQPQMPMGAPALNPVTGGVMPWVAAPAAAPQVPQLAPVPPVAAPQGAVRPAPPPVAAGAVPAARPAPPAPVPPKPAHPVPAKAPPKSASGPAEQGFKIDDLPGFDNLPPVS